MKQTAEKKPNILFRILAFLLTLLLVLGAVAAVAYRDKFNLDALKRWYTYRSLEKNDSGQAELFPIEGSSDSLFCDLSGDLLVCSRAGSHIYSPGGVDYLDDSATMKQPGLSFDGDTAAVYDIGGRELRVYRERSQVFSLSQETEQNILSASVSGSYLTITSQASGYKGVVSVYDSSWKTVLSLCLSSRFLMDGTVTDGTSLAALTVGLQDGAFDSDLRFYRLSGGEEPYAICSLGNQVILGLESGSFGIRALGESSLSVISPDGIRSGQYDYGGRYLKNASLKADDFAVLLLGKYRTGSTADLVTVSTDGSELNSLSVNEQILSLSAKGKYVAVLTADRLDIYTKDLSLYASLDGTQGARNAVQREDGSVFLLTGETARLFIPN